MIRKIAVNGIVFGTLVLAACDGRSMPAPTPVGPPTPGPPGTNQNSDSITGLYTLTISIGSECAVVPEAARTRRYTAAIDQAGGGRYVVTLSDATFLTGPICTSGSRHFSGIGCHQFFASEDIDTVSFFLENNNDEAHGGHIVERLSFGNGWKSLAVLRGNSVDRRSKLQAQGACGTVRRHRRTHFLVPGLSDANPTMCG